MYTLTQAAAATGKQRPAIWKAIKSGRLSASKDENNQWRIDPAELHRVYPVVADRNGLDAVPMQPQETTGQADETNLLRQEVRFLRDQVEDLRTERDRLLKVVERQADSIRQLTDQRQPAPEPPSRSTGRRRIWLWRRPRPPSPSG